MLADEHGKCVNQRPRSLICRKNMPKECKENNDGVLSPQPRPVWTAKRAMLWLYLLSTQPNLNDKENNNIALFPISSNQPERRREQYYCFIVVRSNRSEREREQRYCFILCQLKSVWTTKRTIMLLYFLSAQISLNDEENSSIALFLSAQIGLSEKENNSIALFSVSSNQSQRQREQ